ncbi:sensor histidine kinase [Motilibacter rhizosphaerae]|uniref:sensor histidine kinase n=1 Tax=Motilibacter rhizosphaerae TaxID=598652 RepID=UPI00102B58FC|nr:HAMP domain-containing sensor histidine kinase [Motilibacter rhizosphaerae]
MRTPTGATSGPGRTRLSSTARGLVRTSTLRGRLALLAALAVGGWLLVMGAAVHAVLSHQLSAQADSVLAAHAEAVASTVHVAPGGVRVDSPQDDDALDTDAWVFADGRLVEGATRSGALYAAAADLARVQGGRHGAATRDVDVPHDYRLYAMAVQRDGADGTTGAPGPARVTVVTAVGTGPYSTAQRAALLASAVLAVLVVAGVYVLARLVVARALSPVSGLAQQAAAWSASAPSRRFGAARLPAELAHLAGSLDEMLDRLSAVLRHEQRLTAELSHELRTPLARILAEGELLVDAEGRQLPGAAAITATATEMSALLDTLLRAARAEAATTPGRAELAPVLARVAERAPGVEVEVPAALSVGVEGELVERMLAPLVDNARRHGSAVRVTAARAGREVVVDVVDDGAGLAAADLERVFEPGVSLAPGHGGAGLGLPLARRLARAAGGELVGVPGPGGRFRLTLPPG